MTAELAESLDFIFVNVQAFFAEVGIEKSAKWTRDYMETGTPSAALDVNNPPGYFFGEVCVRVASLTQAQLIKACRLAGHQIQCQMAVSL